MATHRHEAHYIETYDVIHKTWFLGYASGHKQTDATLPATDRHQQTLFIAPLTQIILTPSSSGTMGPVPVDNIDSIFKDGYPLFSTSLSNISLQNYIKNITRTECRLRRCAEVSISA